MPSGITFDVGPLVKLADDMRGAGDRFSRRVVPIMKRGALKIKKDAQARIRAQSSGRYVRQYPASITYDVTVTRTQVVAEIGPDKDKAQGDLGNLLEFGAPNLPWAVPLPHLYPAGDAEIPKTAAAIADALVLSVFK